MDRLHYSKKPIQRLRTRIRELAIDHKPTGLWYSVDGDWEKWCESEEFNFPLPPFVYGVQIVEGRILRLTTVRDLDDFHDAFHASEPEKEYMQDWIDWRRVGETWGGIEIVPYQWERRLDGRVHRWYYGWDCASGCVWDRSAFDITKKVAAV